MHPVELFCLNFLNLRYWNLNPHCIVDAAYFVVSEIKIVQNRQHSTIINFFKVLINDSFEISMKMLGDISYLQSFRLGSRHSLIAFKEFEFVFYKKSFWRERNWGWSWHFFFNFSIPPPDAPGSFESTKDENLKFLK